MTASGERIAVDADLVDRDDCRSVDVRRAAAEAGIRLAVESAGKSGLTAWREAIWDALERKVERDRTGDLANGSLRAF